MEKDKVSIYTDGSCLGNPGPGGWAAIIIIDGVEKEISGFESHTTNNRMEMTAIIEALKILHRKYGEDINKVNIDLFSDSNLIIQTLKLGWKKKANTDLWEQIDKLRAWQNINWTWVKGHHVSKYNNRADFLAVARAKRQA